MDPFEIILEVPRFFKEFTPGYSPGILCEIHLVYPFENIEEVPSIIDPGVPLFPPRDSS